ncbi:MAG: hypothetical protein QGI86_27370, partial [Candidatus Poribacteria bacterium]|nr:hypothetical protein [Candidatus Poribacteria bacterium]
ETEFFPVSAEFIYRTKKRQTEQVRDSTIYSSSSHVLKGYHLPSDPTRTMSIIKWANCMKDPVDHSAMIRESNSEH